MTLVQEQETLDEATAQRIVEMCYDDVLAYCRRHAPSGIEGDDVAQEVFLRFARAHAYREKGTPLAYLLAIARNLCIDASRARTRIPIASLSADLGYCDIPDSHDAFADTELSWALDALDAQAREVIELRFDQGLSVAEIAQVLGVSRFSVHRRLRRALDLLKHELDLDEPVKDAGNPAAIPGPVSPSGKESFDV